ncbi:MAG: RidA family protein [Ornithinimicrobium sp.]
MSPAARLIRSPTLASTAEYAYAAVTVPGSQLVFCAGACPLDAGGATLGVGDIRAQTRQVMDNLRTSLADAGAGFERRRPYNRLRRVIRARGSCCLLGGGSRRPSAVPHDPPSTLIGVPVLGYADQLVEVDAVAAIKV